MNYLRRIGVLAYIIASCTASTIYPSRFIVEICLAMLHGSNGRSESILRDTQRAIKNGEEFFRCIVYTMYLGGCSLPYIHTLIKLITEISLFLKNIESG
jgi:hypothetical protein